MLVRHCSSVLFVTLAWHLLYDYSSAATSNYPQAVEKIQQRIADGDYDDCIRASGDTAEDIFTNTVIETVTADPKLTRAFSLNNKKEDIQAYKDLVTQNMQKANVPDPANQARILTAAFKDNYDYLTVQIHAETVARSLFQYLKDRIPLDETNAADFACEFMRRTKKKINKVDSDTDTDYFFAISKAYRKFVKSVGALNPDFKQETELYVKAIYAATKRSPPDNLVDIHAILGTLRLG